MDTNGSKFNHILFTSGETTMAKKENDSAKKVPFEFIVDILKWLLEINFLKYGEKKPTL